MSPEIVAELAPSGVLRAGINMGNFLLVTGRAENGDPTGVSPSMAAEIARRLGVPVQYVQYARPSELADAAGTGAWDIGLIGAEPQRAAKIDFTAAYVEIEATYLVPPGSPITELSQVDVKGNRIVSSAGAAYTLWLERNIRHAELILVPGGGGAAFKTFLDGKQEVYAGLRPGLLTDVETLPGARILDGQFMAVQQAIGTAKANTKGAAFLKEFVEEAKASGLVARFIAEHKVRGLSVAPAA
ncbi:transporter substrate-binding domain-containing protein [Siccirubricoccus phaeus]|uniref:transporter substrate-binding domain-containing protein n=1 Tax=Siccirubricoccus phaeus TaxID=2595053 RepID=UPI0011F22EBE|nr:transporter substrate-binding domain-containing protein [Siccirubricoccus phaeus]